MKKSISAFMIMLCIFCACSDKSKQSKEIILPLLGLKLSAPGDWENDIERKSGCRGNGI